MYSSVRKKYIPFALECPWLWEIRSCSSPVGYKFLGLFGLV